MKKSKIIGLSLGAVALTSFSLATPMMITSCQTNQNTNTPNMQDMLILDNAIYLSDLGKQKGYKLNREEGTNNYEIISPNSTWTWNEIFGDRTLNNPGVIDDDRGDWFTKQQFLNLGFDKRMFENGAKVGAFPVFGMLLEDGSIKYPCWEEIKESEFSFLDGVQTTSRVVFKNLLIFQVDIDLIPEGAEQDPSKPLYDIYKPYVDKGIIFPFSIKVTVQNN